MPFTGRLLIGLVAAFVATSPVRAATYATLWSFGGGCAGYSPEAGVALGSDGVLYGTTAGGGCGEGDGTLYSFDTSTKKFTTLHIFTGGSDGAIPVDGLIFGGSGVLYGTAQQGGNSTGTVFEYLLTRKKFKVLHAFAASGAEGEYPVSSLALNSSGLLYGTTFAGGTGDEPFGTVFSLVATSRKFASLYSFSYNGSTFPDGVEPAAGVVVGPSGTLYGTTSMGGPKSSDQGTVFALDPIAKSLTILHSFSGGNDGGAPVANLAISNNSLFGTTKTGGKSGLGTVFTINLTTGKLATLYSFKGGDDGATPQGGVVFDAAGGIYGTTSAGGVKNNGVVYKLDASTSKLTTLYEFKGNNDGDSPVCTLAIDAGGSLYGTAQNGGKHAMGTLFKISP